MRALMLAFACRQQYHAMRAIAASGYKVHVLGKDCAQGLQYSRYCASYRNFDFDPLTQSLDDALALITRWARELSADVILPSDIISTRLLAALVNRLPVPSCALPAPDCFDMMNDKWRFYLFCKEQGVKVPQTWLFDDVDALKKAVADGSVPLPVIVKPRGSTGNTGIFRIMKKSDLKALDGADYKPLLTQKLIVGSDIDISTLSNKGRIGAYAVQHNQGGGKYKFMRQDRLLAEATHVIKASEFHGLAHFDAVLEAATGDVYLIECNPRIWGSIYASSVAGLNFIKLSLNLQSLNTNNPQFIADKEVSDRGSTIALIKKIIKERSTNKTDYMLLKYNLMDPVGKKYIDLKELNELTPIAHQMAALAAISAKKI